MAARALGVELGAGDQRADRDADDQLLAGLEPGDAVMDLGCGPGLLAIPFAQAGMKVTAVDPEPEMLEAAGAARAAGRRWFATI